LNELLIQSEEMTKTNADPNQLILFE